MKAPTSLLCWVRTALVADVLRRHRGARNRGAGGVFHFTGDGAEGLSVSGGPENQADENAGDPFRHAPLLQEDEEQPRRSDYSWRETGTGSRSSGGLYHRGNMLSIALRTGESQNTSKNAWSPDLHVLTSAMFDTIISSMRVFAAATSLTLVILGVGAGCPGRPQSRQPVPPRSGLAEQEGVPKGDIRGPFTLPSAAYPGTQHTYWVYVPAQYTPVGTREPDGVQRRAGVQESSGNIRAHNVLDNLIYRREIPVMIAVFINPGRRPDQPEPTPQNWGDRDTNRPTEYNSLDDRYARVIVDELLPALEKDYTISQDPERHGIGGASSGPSPRSPSPGNGPTTSAKSSASSAASSTSVAGTRIRISCCNPRRSRSACFCRTAATTIARSRAPVCTTRPATGSIRTSVWPKR